jgi:DNA-binding transcriptional ArsR family regulator
MDDVDHQDVRKGFPPRRQPSASGPWCWQEKGALNLIMCELSEGGGACAGRSVYLALTEFASDAQSASFVITVAEIAHRAGISKRTTTTALKQLEEIGLVRIERRHAPEGGFLKLPSCYTLTSIGIRCASMRSRCTSMRNEENEASFADIQKEFGNNNAEKSKKHDHAHAGRLSLAKTERGTSVIAKSAEQEDLINQIGELCASENRTEKFRTVWEMRTRDHPVETFQAIGETRRMKREGQIRKTIGGTLNWNFKFFCKEGRKRKASAI